MSIRPDGTSVQSSATAQRGENNIDYWRVRGWPDLCRPTGGRIARSADLKRGGLINDLERRRAHDFLWARSFSDR